MLIKRERDEDEEEKKLNIIIKINMQQLKKRKPPVQWKAYCSSIFILNLQTNMNQNNPLFSKKNKIIIISPILFSVQWKLHIYMKP